MIGVDAVIMMVCLIRDFLRQGDLTISGLT
jgi:hypothetical protein